MLYSQVPLVDFGITGDSCVQVAAVVESPVRQLSVGSALCGGASPAGKGLSSVAYCVSKLSVVKYRGAVFENEGPAYWKLVATFMP